MSKDNNKIIASNGYIGITEIKYNINDYIKTNVNNRYKRIRYNSKSEPYFIQNGIRYYLQDFMRCN